MNPAATTETARASLLNGLRIERAQPSADLGEQILGAAVGEIEDFGLRRFTIEGVARRVGVSRMTVYRHYPKKHLLIEAVLQYEVRQFLQELDEAVKRCETLEERLVEGLVCALSALRNHRLLNRLLRTEPESLLPSLTVQAAPILTATREFIADFAKGEGTDEGLALSETENLVVSELLARIVLSFVLTPDSLLKLDTPADIRRFAEHYLTPILHDLEKPSPRTATGKQS